MKVLIFPKLDFEDVKLKIGEGSISEDVKSRGKLTDLFAINNEKGFLFNAFLGIVDFVLALSI